MKNILLRCDDVRRLAGLCRQFADVIEKDEQTIAGALSIYDLEALTQTALDVIDASCAPGAEEFEVKASAFLDTLQEYEDDVFSCDCVNCGSDGLADEEDDEDEENNDGSGDDNAE